MADPLTWAVVGSLAYGAYSLLKSDDDVSTNARGQSSVRGILAPYVLGHARAAPVMCYVGNRSSEQEDVDSGGKSDSLSSSEQTVYYENGMHILAQSIGTRIELIYQAGVNILDSPIDSDDYPSGSTITLDDDEGSFTVYWGDDDQGVDSTLKSLTGLKSSYPKCFYIVWKKKRLGTTAVWPQLEYRVRVDTINPLADGPYIAEAEVDMDIDMYAMTAAEASAIAAEVLTDDAYTSLLDLETTSSYVFRTSDSSIEDATSAASLDIDDEDYASQVVNVFYNSDTSKYYVFVDTYIPSDIRGESWEDVNVSIGQRKGVNPASAIYQMLFESYPHGLGQSTDLYDLTTLDTLAVLFATDDELSPASVLLSGGSTIQDGLYNLMQDFGIVRYMEPTTGLFGFKAIREGEEAETLPSESYNSATVSREFSYATLDADVQIYSFKDSDRKFLDSTITVSDDAGASYSENPNTKKVSLNSVTDYTTATMVASRKEQEQDMDETISLQMGADYMYLKIGDLVTFDDFSDEYRIVEKAVDVDSATITFGFLIDTYSVTNNYISSTSNTAVSVASIDIGPDFQTQILEANRLLNADTDAFYPLRIRSSENVSGAALYASQDGVTYSYVGAARYQTGGVLAEAMEADTSALLDEGPEITIYGYDSDSISDLTSSESLWRAGYQLAVVDSELMFVEGYDSSTGKLEGIIRARYGTSQAAHEEGAEIYIFLADNMQNFTTSYLQSGITLYVKQVPYSSQNTYPIDDLSPDTLEYQGGGYRPLSPENLTTEDSTNSWESGEDVELGWSYKNGEDQSGAGIGLSDEVSDAADPEGYFKLVIYDGDDAVRTVTNLTDASYSYSNANMVSDFGTEPDSFAVQVTNILNGLISDAAEVTLTQV